MKTKRINKQKITNKITTAVNTAKNNAAKANNHALNTTEEIVLETIFIASEWQKITDKALKGGVQLMENQQDLIFNTLEILKSQILEGKKSLKKVFA
jgi:hypothetical protein